MKNKLPHRSAFLLSAAIILAFAHPVLAQEKETPTVIPDTPTAIHQAVDKETDEMAKLIQTGTIKDLHHHAFAVRDLVAALPDKSASLPADKLEGVKSKEKFVATLADRLDAAGDANDKAVAEENFGKLKGILASVWAYYPAASGAPAQ